MLCADAGSDYCPCYLGISGDCLVCGRMNDLGSECSCDWSGVCVYSHYLSSLRSEADGREERAARVKQVERINEEHVLFSAECSRSLASKLALPGAFVFVRPLDRPFSFFVPLSVLKVKDGLVWLLLKTVGPKSKAACHAVFSPGEECCGQAREMVIKGPYWNGVFGLSTVRNLRLSSALMILRGTGQAVGIGVALELTRHQNEVHAVVDPAEVQRDLVGDDLRAMGCKVSYADVRTSKGTAFLASMIMTERPALVFSGGPDGQHYRLERLMALLGLTDAVALAGSNNTVMVCGEGTCGACFRRARSNSPAKLKGCKGNLDLREIVPDSTQWK